MTAQLSVRVCSGPGAGTESASVPGLAWMDIDSAVIDPDANPITPGQNSYEKWLRLALDAADGQVVSGFWVERTGVLPDGVTLKVGITSTGATPTAAASTVATETMHEGRRYFFDGQSYDADGARTTFVVVQEQVAASAPSGQVDTQAVQFGWQAA